MNIYIDESGSFVNAPTAGAWNAVAALAVPEGERRNLEVLVLGLRQGNKEAKLNDLTEIRYLQFLEDLAQLNVAVFSTATDAGLNTPAKVAEHQQHQVDEILRNIDKMKYEGGRQGVSLMATQLAKLSPQLYVQLLCQVNLMFDVVSRAITYFAQSSPSTLREFRWRVDQKNISRTEFEDAFEKLTPALLQTRSITDPLLLVRGFDYSKMSQYEFEDGKLPEYLKDDYGIQVESGINIQKMIRGNLKFVDSAGSVGVQAVDLIVSGIRRCLRKQFANNEEAAAALGKLMMQAPHNGPPLNLISFVDDAPIEEETAGLVRSMARHTKGMIRRN